jgi:formate dehydrogenase subunit beta
VNVNHILHIRNADTVKTLQDFLAAWWLRVELDAMLAPVELPDHSGVSAQLITRPDELEHVNPFAPVMLNNTASLIQGFVEEHPHSHLAVLLRPCELRAMIELRKRHRVCYQSVAGGNPHENLVVMSVDCPGTFSEVEYVHEVSDHQPDAEMLHVQVSYGRQATYVPYKVRESCQMCDSPSPIAADVTIGTIGIEPQGDLLVIARDESIDTDLQLPYVTDGFASEFQVVCREMMVGKLADQHAERRTALMEGHPLDPQSITNALAMLARCTLCADCLDACPLYDGELAGMLGVGEGRQNGHALLAEVVKVSRWLVSCSGCGMCRESCENGVPLHQLVTTLSHRIQSELHYRPGDPAQPLPWTV